MEKIFETAKGSQYFFNGKSWLRLKFDGSSSMGVRYIGSVNPKENLCFVNGFGVRDKKEFLDQIARGEVPGFSPKFEVGYVPIGFIGLPRDTEISEGKISLKDLKYLDSLLLHVGHEISAIYKNLDSLKVS